MSGPVFFKNFLFFENFRSRQIWDLIMSSLISIQHTVLSWWKIIPLVRFFFRKKTIKKDERLSLTAFSMIACRWSLVAPPVSIIMILQSFPHLMKIDTKWQKVGSRLKLWKFSSYKTTLISLINVGYKSTVHYYYSMYQKPMVNRQPEISLFTFLHGQNSSSPCTAISAILDP